VAVAAVEEQVSDDVERHRHAELVAGVEQRRQVPPLRSTALAQVPVGPQVVDPPAEFDLDAEGERPAHGAALAAAGYRKPGATGGPSTVLRRRRPL
jgi:hypothetical protein